MPTFHEGQKDRLLFHIHMVRQRGLAHPLCCDSLGNRRKYIHDERDFYCSYARKCFSQWKKQAEQTLTLLSKADLDSELLKWFAIIPQAIQYGHGGDRHDAHRDGGHHDGHLDDDYGHVHNYDDHDDAHLPDL